MLLYEFAMTPDLFDPGLISTNPQLEIILVELLRGMCDNGLVANLHNEGWHSYVRTRLTGLAPDLQHRVIECLTTLHDRNRLVTHPSRVGGNPVDDHDWFELALVSHRTVPFYSIFLSQTVLNIRLNHDPTFHEACCIEFSAALNSPLWRQRTRTIRLTQSIADYRRILTPILRHARALTLVDPYMNPHEDRFFDTVELGAELLGRQSFGVHHPGRVHIHVGNKEVLLHGRRIIDTVRDRFNAWERRLQPLARRFGHRFRVFIWRKRPRGERFHARFILTDQCGISTPEGLDYSAPPTRTTWTLLEYGDFTARLQDYDPATSPFDLLGEREVR